METKERKISDSECLLRLQTLLKMFHDIIKSDPPAEKVAEELKALKEMAIKSQELTARQIDAIVARCDNYMNGTYGNTKSKENLSHQTK